MDIAINKDVLAPEHDALLENISKYGTKKQIPCYPNTSDNVKLWEGRVFKEFVLRRTDLRKEFEQLFKGKVNIDISYQTFYVCDSGMGAKSTVKVFYLAAKLHDMTPTEYLKEFVEYCIKREGFTPRAFKEDDEVIQKLLGKNKSLEETPQLSLQDVVTINSEIDGIRRDLDFYPYGKDKLAEDAPEKKEAALRKVEQLLSVSPNNVDLLALKSYLLCGLKKPKEARKISEKLYKKNSENLDVAISYAMALGRLKKYRRSLNITREAQRLHPNSHILSYLSGVSLKCLRRHEEAIIELLHAISLDEDCVKPHKMLASIYTQMNKFEECDTALKAALRIAPNNEKILLELMANLARQGKNDEAIEYVQVLIDSGKEGSISKHFLALKKITEGNSTEAKIIIRDLVGELESEKFGDGMGKSTSYYLLSVLFQMVYEAEPENHNFLHYAKECCLDALKLDPKNLSALEEMAKQSFLDGDIMGAKSYLDKISEICQDNMINGGYGWSYYLELSFFAREKCRVE